LLAALAALALAGCSGGGLGDLPAFGKASDAWNVDPNRFPADYRNELLSYLRVQLSDPTNVRAAYVTEPALRTFGTESRYAVCVRYNARNSEGRYQGSQDNIAIYYGGRLNQLREATAEQCGAVAYQPFPELEKLKRLDAR